MVKIAAVGIMTVLLALQLKEGKKEYALYLVLAAGIWIFSSVLGQMQGVLFYVKEYLSEIPMAGSYLAVLCKIIGIAYLAEFSAGICKDAGYAFLSGQIELAGKFTILSLSMPIVAAVFGMLRQVLS